MRRSGMTGDVSGPRWARFQKVRATITKPAVNLIAAEDHRHPIVNGRHERIRFCRQDRDAADLVFRLRICPAFVKAGKAQDRSVHRRDVVRLLGLAFPSRFHSKKPLAGTMQRRSAKAFLNTGFSATVSDRAFIMREASIRYRPFAQNGRSPQCICVSDRPASTWSTTSTDCVGATFQLGLRFCGVPNTSS